MEITVKLNRNNHPNTYYRFVFFDLTFINTYQVWSVNLTILNIFFKILKEK